MSEIVKRVQELLKLPQNLCRMCGKCCRIATFKGALSYEEIKKLAESTTEQASQVEGAKDFLSIFVPYKSREDARKVASEFVDMVLEKFGEDSQVSFFCCKFITDENHCQIHEDRPHLCRMYPIPHERTLYNEGCGFAEQGKKNWQEIQDIINKLESQRQQ